MEAEIRKDFTSILPKIKMIMATRQDLWYIYAKIFVRIDVKNEKN